MLEIIVMVQGKAPVAAWYHTLQRLHYLMLVAKQPLYRAQACWVPLQARG
jgi:hypothetical protein